MPPRLRSLSTGLTAAWMSIVLWLCAFPEAVAADDATTTLVVTVTGTAPHAAPTPSTDSRSYLSERVFKRDMLQKSNFYRQQHNASALKWSELLASYAQDYATQCLWEHSGGPYGENLATGYENVTAAVEGWGREQQDYDWGDPHFSEETGHFTQLVWQDTTDVGCGRMNCGDGDPDNGEAVGWYVVCEYYPPGNVEGEYQQQVQEGPNSGAGGQVGRGVGSIALAVGLTIGGLFVCV